MKATPSVNCPHFFLTDYLLEYLKEVDIERYRAIVKTLNLRR